MTARMVHIADLRVGASLFGADVAVDVLDDRAEAVVLVRQGGAEVAVRPGFADELVAAIREAAHVAGGRQPRKRREV